MKQGVFLGDARELNFFVDAGSVALSVWSPPYHVGKQYELDQSFLEWKSLLRRTLAAHAVALKPGGFVAVNIADILCFPDSSMPRLMAENVSRRKRADITRERVVQAMSENPGMNRRQIADLLGCSEQTVDRRLKGNNIRGGKYQTQTRVLLVGGLLEQYAMEAGLYLYDRRVWVKDAAWENSRWHTMSYRAVDEFEYIYIFWKPGQTRVDRNRITKDEWIEWGSRAVWRIPSVRSNDDHEAKFPVELPRRIIQLLSDPGDWVLDPFVGSGTSAVAAAQEERNFIGIDKEPHYVEMANRAWQEARRQIPLLRKTPVAAATACRQSA
ncbi:MAG: DNA methyltransferase [Thiomonas sp.]|uniref:DNA methyltransferase n=1 Tax=Thiomonas sp. TaxID=2047785 RepID=UPI002A36522C|nr:DNA methyltransferase [Thiomonas sp.]MDY0331295.1 DNA methyltransferase [Thiomonas sp.]